MKPLLEILFLSACLFSCSGVNQPKEVNRRNLTDTLLPMKENGNLDSANENQWLAVTFDMSKGDYIIEKPCDGHTPTIQVTQSTLIDDKGIDEPIKYQIVENASIDKNRDLLKLSYVWADGQLSDSIIIIKIEGYEGIYQWKRYPKYKGEPQDTIVSYFVNGNHVACLRKIKIECPDKKIIETEKKPFE